MSAWLLLAGLAVWGLGAGVDLLPWTLLRAARRPVAAATALAGAIGGGFVCAAGVVAVLGHTRTVDLGTTLGVGRTLVRLDGLSGIFLTLTGGLAVLISAALWGWLRRPGAAASRAVTSGYLLLLGSCTVILAAGDAFTFLFAWESLTVAFFVLSGARRAVRAGWVTFAAGKVSGAALLFGMLLVAGAAGTLDFGGWSHLPPGGVHDAGFVLLVVGFGVKVGMIPFQVWLPIGYPPAAGPTRAAMAGVAANVGFYGLWRFLGVLGRPPVWLAVAVLVLGGITALLGIAFAAVQVRFTRLVAYSSVENAGVILVGYGVALAGETARDGRLVAVGLLAASLQVLAHAVAKSGLFVAGAFFEAGHGTDDLDWLRGVGRRQPWSGVTCGLAALTLAGLPPTIGFVSEWFILEALLQQFRLHGLPLRFGMAVGGAMVALTAGVAALAFARLIGLTVLGRHPAGPLPHPPGDRGIAARGGLLGLAVSCLALALAAPWVVRFIAHGLGPIVPATTVAGALKSPWVLQPVFANFSILSPTWLFVTMPIGFAAVGVAATLVSRGGLLRVRRVPAWRSASAGVAGPSRYSSFGYANPARHVLGNILGTRRQAAYVDPISVEDAAGAPVPEAHLKVTVRVVEPVETYLYRPAGRALQFIARGAKRLQSGRLDAYVAYMLLALLVILAVAAASQ